jgi:hypothetical protein
MTQYKAMAASWGRAFLAAALATYTINGLDFKAILASGVAAIVPMAMRWANPNDKVFGLVK